MTNQTKPRLTREDLDAKISALQEKNRARRANKVTPEELESRLTERRARRQAASPSGRRAQVVSLCLGVALLVGAGAIGVATTSGTQTFELAGQGLQQQIAQAQGQLDAIPAADQKAASKYASDLNSQLAAAAVKGREVAALQQQFTAILFQGNTEQAPTNGAPGPAFLASVQHRKLLEPYFVERAFVADPAQAYSPGSYLPFGDTQIDPRFPWFVAHQSGASSPVADPSTTSWALASLVATQTPGVFEATWLDTNPSTGALLAWGTASYYVDQGKFGSLKVGTTTLASDTATQLQTAGK